MVTFNGKQYADWNEARAAEARRKADEPSIVATIDTESPGEPVAAPPAESSGKRQSLADKWRPRCLNDLAGQPEVVQQLRAFVSDPYPCAFLLAGETGTGKSSAAVALAAELGCCVEQGEFGGVYSIASGENTPAEIIKLWDSNKLYTMPFGSSRGWKVVIVNEVESLNGKVELLWLDRLESLPSHTVVIFSTNKIDTLPARFVDRCIGGVIEFLSSADDLSDPARQLARSIWRAEVGGDIPDDVLDRVIVRSTTAGRLSFRRVVQHLTPVIASAKGKAQ